MNIGDFRPSRLPFNSFNVLRGISCRFVRMQPLLWLRWWDSSVVDRTWEVSQFSNQQWYFLITHWQSVQSRHSLLFFVNYIYNHAMYGQLQHLLRLPIFLLAMLLTVQWLQWLQRAGFLLNSSHTPNSSQVTWLYGMWRLGLSARKFFKIRLEVDNSPDLRLLFLLQDLYREWR